MLSHTTCTDSGLQPTFPFADDLMALERLDVLALQETHCDKSGPPASRRSRVLAHSGTSCLAAGVALLTPSGSSWMCSSQHSLVPGHALLADLYHGKSTESVWVLCVYADSSRLIGFYQELMLELTSFIATLPANSWKGCVALGDWNMVEHPADRAPQKAPDSVFWRCLRLFTDLKALCCASDVAGPDAFPRSISFRHRASSFSARLNRIYAPRGICAAGRPVTVPTLWSDHSLVWALLHITNPRVELAKPAPCLPGLPVLDGHLPFWLAVLTTYECLLFSGVSLASWSSFKGDVLALSLQAKKATNTSRTKCWKSLLRGDLVPESDLTDAIRHHGFSLSPPARRCVHTHGWRSAVADPPALAPRPSPPRHSRWPSTLRPPLPPWRSSSSSADLPTASLCSSSEPPAPAPLPASDLAIATFVSMRADHVRRAVLKKYRDMARTHSSAWFKLSSNKEADERGSRASISVEGLCRSPADPASTRLRDMVVIAREYYHALHTPLPDSADRLSSQDALVQEVANCYGGVPAPPLADQLSGPFSLEEVMALRPKMPNSAPGPDGIQYSFWKALAARIDTLNDRSPGPDMPSFWASFRLLSDDLCLHGTDRLGFKDTNLSLFYKKGDPTLVANYRPISSMNTDCKMFTNLVNTHLAPWAMSKLHTDQKGFVPLRYITEHTRLCSEVAHLSNASGTPGYIVSLDQAKAYDRVDVHLLLRSMLAMGLPADLLGMIRDILTNCHTRIRINGGYSGFFSLRRGVRQGDPLSCLLYNFSIEPMGMRLHHAISGISLLGLPAVKLIQYADDMNLFLSPMEDLALIKSTMDSTSSTLGSKFNLEKTDILIIGPPEHHDVSHTDVLACFEGGFVLPRGLPLRVLGAWIGSPDCVTDRWVQIYAHIKKIIRQWNAIGASLLNWALLAKALLLSQCYYLLNCNGIPAPMLNKITNSVCRFIHSPYSHMPYSFLSAPLSRGRLNCPSLRERKLAYDAKFIGDLISAPFDLPWKAWARADLSCASSKPGKLPGTNLNPLLQRSVVRLSSLEPRLRHAYISCRTLRYDISCAFPSMAARLDMPSTYHPAVPLRANHFSDDLVRRHVTTISHLMWPGTKLTRADADPMPFRLRGLLGSVAKTASDLYAHTRVSCLSPASGSSDSDSDLSDTPPRSTRVYSVPGRYPPGLAQVSFAHLLAQ